MDHRSILDVDEIKKTKGIVIKKGSPGEISGISTDSRKTVPGDLFVALKGPNFDGHDFIPEAAAHGASALLVESSWYSQIESDTSLPVLLTADTIIGLGELAMSHRKKLECPVIAITGTNGKTTTKDMTVEILSKKFKVFYTQGNCNNYIGVPLTILKASPEHELGVVELGTNHFGEIEYLTKIAMPTHSAITNIGTGHTAFLISPEWVAGEKGKIFKFPQDSGVAFVNLDDRFVPGLAENVKNKVTYSLNRDAAVTGKLLAVDANGYPRFSLNDQVEIKLGIPGNFNISNALCAAAIGLQFGISHSQIKDALEKFSGPSKRMEIKTIKGIKIIDDCYNANPDSMRQSLITLSHIKAEGRKILILGDMLELGKLSQLYHREVGKKVVELGYRYLLTYGKDSRYIHREISKDKMALLRHFTSKKALAGVLERTLKEGDLIFIKGSRGMQMEEIINFVFG